MSSEPLQKIKIPYIRLFLGYFFWIWMGCLVGFAFLANEPAKSASYDDSSLENETSDSGLFGIRNKVIHFRDTGYALGGATLTRKLYAQGINPVVITVSELNAWSKDNFGRSKQRDSSSKGMALMVEPKAPEFAVALGELHMAYPVKLSLLGQSMDVKLITSGSFEQNESLGFAPSSLAVNSAPVPFHAQVFGLLKPSINDFIETNEATQKIQSAWSDFDRIELARSAIALHRE
jgi:hypothetical protein